MIQSGVGFVVGGLVDYGMQVSANLIQGKGWDSFTDVSLSQIILSAVTGAITGGVSTWQNSALKTALTELASSVAQEYSILDKWM